MNRAILNFLLASAVAPGQAYRGEVQGIITDTTDAAVLGPLSRLTNANTGLTVVRATDAGGNYFFDYVEAGAYTVSVDAPGFQKVIQQNVTVQVRGDVTVDLRIAVGNLTASVTVTDVPAGIQFNTTSRELTNQRNLGRDIQYTARLHF